MTRKLLSRLILLAIVALVAALAYQVLRHPGGTIEPVESENISTTGPMTISGFGFSTYDGARLTSRVQADLFRIKPRKFAIFKIKSMNEVALVNALFEINPDENTGEKGSLLSLGGEFTSRAAGMSGSKGMGRITRAVMDGMTLAFHRGEEPFLRAGAKKGEMDFTKMETKMEGAVLEHLPSGKKIASRTIVWDDEARIFKIPGKYEAITSRGKASGRGITVDLDFNVKKLPLSGR